MKRCGLYIRVSTEKQARVEEGSLKNQEQLLVQHIDVKSKVSGETLQIVDKYVDQGRSAKDTKRPEYQRMLADIEVGKIDTVICTALSRISRSTRDLLEMIDYFKKKNVDFICLKEDFDTTTAQGKCFVTIMGALNEFEREQTSERTKSSMFTRAERGLWNGGHVFGYDLSKSRKGYLEVNEKEAEIVRFAFNTYLDTGSAYRTREIMNARGFRTKEYTSRYGKKHPASEFSLTGVHQILTNYAYIKKKEVNKKVRHKNQTALPEEQRYKIVDAVWDSIIPEEKFSEVQRLLKENCDHRHNGAKPSRHFYLLNGGILFCKDCGSRMEGRNGYGKKGMKAYYYYFCTNKACRFRLPQGEIERGCFDLMAKVSQEERIFGRIVTKLNQRLRNELPRLKERKKQLETQLSEVKAEAEEILKKYQDLSNGREFVEERLATLAKQRDALEKDLQDLQLKISGQDRQTLDEDAVRKILTNCYDLFTQDLKPYQRRHLLNYTLERIGFSDKVCEVGIRLDPSVLSPVDRMEVSSESSRGSHLLYSQ